jgi:hypothetical protein
MIVVSYWTNDAYKEYGLRMEASAKRLGLPTSCDALADRGSWQANNYIKPAFILDKLNQFNQPVLWVDADAVFHRMPDFLLWETSGFDVAAYYHGVKNPWAGTLFFQDNLASRKLLKLWIRLIQEAQPGMDQDVLSTVLAKSYEFNTLRLPPSYCWVERFMRRHYPAAQPVIEHFTITRPVGSMR